MAKLREQIVKANALVREANFLAEEMSKLTDYQVTLQIPAANLNANRKVRKFAILYKVVLYKMSKSPQYFYIQDKIC